MVLAVLTFFFNFFFFGVASSAATSTDGSSPSENGSCNLASARLGPHRVTVHIPVSNSGGEHLLNTERHIIYIPRSSCQGTCIK